MEIFHSSCRHYSDKIAVTDGVQDLTYSELLSKSQLIAQMIQDRGVRAGDRVALYLERSSTLIAAILGVLQAGAAYVPIDVAYPAARTELMLEHSKAKVLLTSNGLASTLASPLPVITMTDLPSNFRAERGESGSGVFPESAAVVYFTSGSTGVPKAVVCEHRSLVNLARNSALEKVECSDVMGQVSSPAFDAFSYELWVAIAAGATLAILPKISELMLGFREKIAVQGVSVMLLPTMFVNEISQLDPSAFNDLRLLSTGGDVLPPKAVSRVLSSGFSGVFSNLYGPTEGTTASSVYPITTPQPNRSVSIGEALGGVEILLLNSQGAEVLAGETGEMNLGGAGLARGYLGQAAMTAERFVPDPRGGGGRVYRTGDLARQIDGGSLEFLGRADAQVKVRGYRIEPQEVSVTLTKVPGILDAVTVPYGEGSDRRLVSFLVTDGRPTKELVFARMQSDLPEFMVPSQFIFIDAIPVNHHGKRDLPALYQKIEESKVSTIDRFKPVTDTEKYLAELWARLIGVDDVTRYDSFFELGGNSLKAFALLKDVETSLKVKLHPRVVLQRNTLAEVAAEIDTAKQQLDRVAE